MKNKVVAALLALIGGTIGLHRFYLGQVGLGILYIFIPFISFFLGFIDAFKLLTMNDRQFNQKYNREPFSRGGSFENEKQFERSQQAYKKQKTGTYQPREATASAPVQNKNPNQRLSDLKQSGIQKFKDFDLKASILDFETAYALAPKDTALLYNLACAYSLNEEPTKAFSKLDQAVALGFKDFDRLRTHEALSFLRAHQDWPRFEGNSFRLPQGTDHSDILDQLKRLQELRDRGLLSEVEYAREAAKFR